MASAPSIVGLLLLLGLGFFFGLAFEEFHARSNQKRPGGVRSFPLLALTIQRTWCRSAPGCWR
jgi:hypothetical protein